MNVNGN